MDQQPTDKRSSPFWQAYEDWKSQLTPDQREKYRDDRVERQEMFSDFMEVKETQALVMQLGPEERRRINRITYDAAFTAERAPELRRLGFLAKCVYGKERG